MEFNAPIYDAKALRATILRMAFAGSTVHIGCAFSVVELFAVLYRSFVTYPDNNPSHPERDYLVLSKGHGVMAQYACMLERGWLSQADVSNYFADGTALKGLSDSRVPGLEVTSGSLGHGCSVGVGMALGAKLANTKQKTFILLGDGEINEGPVWEAAMFAAHHELSRAVFIVDANGFQAMGTTDEVIKLGNIQHKFESFGFEAQTVDGHDESALENALRVLLASTSPRPKALIAQTVKGKGVSFMENDNIWHYTRLTPETYQQSLAELGFDA